MYSFCAFLGHSALLLARVGRPMPGRKASTPTICVLVVQVRKLPEEKKGKKKQTNIYGIKCRSITNTQLHTPQHTYNHGSVTVFTIY